MIPAGPILIVEQHDIAPLVDPRFIAALEDLERGVEQRFPAARAYVRAGLDCPVC